MTEEQAARLLELIPRFVALEKQIRALMEKHARTIPDHPMSPAEVGKIVGRSEMTVRRWVDDGKLRAKHIDRTMLITPDALRTFLAE